MIIERLAVQNYRAVRDTDVEFDSLVYLVGRNGVGKSTLLNALGVFFGRIRPSLSDCSAGHEGVPIEISATFTELGETAEGEFQKYVRDGRLSVVKRISFADGATTEGYYARSLGHPAFADMRRLPAGAKIAMYREQFQQQYEMPACRSAADVDIALIDWEHGHPGDLELIEDDGKFFGYRNVAAGKLDKYIDFVLVPAVRDAATDASEGRDSTLKLLMDAVVRRAANVHEPVRDLRERVVRDYAELLESPALSLETIQQRVTAAMQRYAPGTEVTFEWDRLEDARLPDPTVSARVVDDGVVGNISSKGHGLQRAYIMATLQALAEAESARAAEEADNGTNRGLVLAVEEPELYQHPAQARRIASTFIDLTQPGTGIQVIACTHSPVFLNVGAFDRVRLVRKPPFEGVPQTSIARATLDGVAARLEAMHSDGRGRTGRGLQPGLVGLLNPYTNEAFFADFVVLAEGEEDKALLEAALHERLDQPPLAHRAVAIVPVSGKKNLDKMFSILAELDIPRYVVFDRDGETREDARQVENWNLALQRMVGAPEPQPMPDTIATSAYAVFSPNLTDVVKSELGGGLWLDLRQRACDRLGLENRTGIEKNPIVVREMLDNGRADGARSTSIESVADAIESAISQCFAGEIG